MSPSSQSASSSRSAVRPAGSGWRVLVAVQESQQRESRPDSQPPPLPQPHSHSVTVPAIINISSPPDTTAGSHLKPAGLLLLLQGRGSTEELRTQIWPQGAEIAHLYSGSGNQQDNPCNLFTIVTQTDWQWWLVSCAVSDLPGKKGLNICRKLKVLLKNN